MDNPSVDQPYKIVIYDNVNFLDQDSSYIFGTYTLLSDAIKNAQNIVNEFLASKYTLGIKERDLFRTYSLHGKDPAVFDVNLGKVIFSGWDYAKEKCKEMCQPNFEI